MTAFAKTSLKLSVNSSSQSNARIQGLPDQMVRAKATDIFQQLQEQGYHHRDIISVSSQLIDLITQQLVEQK